MIAPFKGISELKYAKGLLDGRYMRDQHMSFSPLFRAEALTIKTRTLKISVFGLI